MKHQHHPPVADEQEVPLEVMDPELPRGELERVGALAGLVVPERLLGSGSPGASSGGGSGGALGLSLGGGGRAAGRGTIDGE